MLEIEVTDKIAKLMPGECQVIVCDNTDYSVHFTFDEEWGESDIKTARFIYGDEQYTDVTFTGNTVVVPKLTNTKYVLIGVFVNDLLSTTAAKVLVLESIRTPDGDPLDPTSAVYDTIIELINSKPHLSESDVQSIIAEYLVAHPETDPTVPEWAKAENKPTYNADEVGAYTKAEVDGAIATAETETDTKLLSYRTIADSYTKTEVDSKIAAAKTSIASYKIVTSFMSSLNGLSIAWSAFGSGVSLSTFTNIFNNHLLYSIIVNDPAENGSGETKLIFDNFNDDDQCLYGHFIYNNKTRYFKADSTGISEISVSRYRLISDSYSKSETDTLLASAGKVKTVNGVEPDANGNIEIEGGTGKDGTTFTPSVSADGTLSWTNDGGKDNPASVNIKGAKGDTGEKGEKGDTGATGPQGPKGDTGAAFTYADFTAEQLAALKGDTGAKGADGATPNIQIGTVETLAAGSDATASITGTTENPLLNLGIPKGKDGSGGETWENIHQGAIGATGVNTYIISKDNDGNDFALKKFELTMSGTFPWAFAIATFNGTYSKSYFLTNNSSVSDDSYIWYTPVSMPSDYDSTQPCYIGYKCFGEISNGGVLRMITTGYLIYTTSSGEINMVTTGGGNWTPNLLNVSTSKGALFPDGLKAWRVDAFYASLKNTQFTLRGVRM